MISFLMVLSLCISLWSPIGSNVVLAEGNTTATYKIVLKEDAENEAFTLESGGEYNLGSVLKVVKEEGEESADVTAQGTLAYTTSNEDVATVSEEGRVTAKSVNTNQSVDITVTWKNSDESATEQTVTETFTFTVKAVSIINVQIEAENKTLVINSTYDLSADVEILPAEVAKELIYTSSDEAVVSVNDVGVLKAEKEGTSVVTVASKNNSEIKDTITIKVIDIPVSLELNKTTHSMKATDTFKMEAQVVYASGKKVPVGANVLTFESLDKTIVTVDANGVVTGLVQSSYPKTAVVQVSYKFKYDADSNAENGEEEVDLVSASCQVTVTKIPVESVVIENEVDTVTLKINDTYTLKSHVLPTNATDTTVSYKSSDKDVAKVSSSGVITATGIGEATITAYAKEDSSVKDTFVVKVFQTSFNIAELGATGTDKSNDASAINKILRYATKIDEPITVVVPDGTYYIGSTLKIYTQTNLVLSENAVIKRMQSAGDKAMLMNRTDPDGIEPGYSQCRDIVITGGTWDGNATGADDANCLYFGHAQNITITDTVIKNNSGAHLIEFAGVQNALVENVELYGYTMCTASDYTAAQADKEAIQIDYCSAGSAPAMKPYDGTACDTITIRNCNIHDYMAGVGTHTSISGVYSNNIRIENNTFTNITNACINLRNFNNVNIEKNTANNCTTFVYASDSQGKIKSNKATNGTSYKPKTNSGLRAKNGITISNGSSFTIEKNTFQKAKSNGICIWNGSTATIKNNKLKNNKLYGIRTQGSTVTLKKNSFSKNKKGLYHTYKDAKIKSSDDIRAYYIDIKKSYKYKGKAVKPKIKIKNLNKKYYKVTYKNNKKPGTATVIIKGKGKVKQTLKIKYKIKK